MPDASRRKWPPSPYKGQSGSDQIIDGEPVYIKLVRFPHESVARGQIVGTCCDCGLRHLHTYEVYYDPSDKGWWIVNRDYRIEDKRKR